MWKHDVIHKTGSTKYIAVRGGPSHGGTATGNMYTKFGEI